LVGKCISSSQFGVLMNIPNGCFYPSFLGEPGREVLRLSMSASRISLAVERKGGIDIAGFQSATPRGTFNMSADFFAPYESLSILHSVALICSLVAFESIKVEGYSSSKEGIETSSADRGADFRTKC